MMDSVDRLERSVTALCTAAADSLRNAVHDFNRMSPTLASIDTFRERVLRVADHLADPLPPAPVIPEPAVTHIISRKGFGWSVKA